jgi:hypothetical protein
VPVGPVGTVLVVVPDEAVSGELQLTLTMIGAPRVLLARSVPAVCELLPRLVAGALAVVSSVFGPDTDEVIRLLRDTGWQRVLVLTRTGATGPALSGVAAGATGVLSTPGTGTDPNLPRPGCRTCPRGRLRFSAWSPTAGATGRSATGWRCHR